LAGEKKGGGGAHPGRGPYRGHWEEETQNGAWLLEKEKETQQQQRREKKNRERRPTSPRPQKEKNNGPKKKLAFLDKNLDHRPGTPKGQKKQKTPQKKKSPAPCHNSIRRKKKKHRKRETPGRRPKPRRGSRQEKLFPSREKKKRGGARAQTRTGLPPDTTGGKSIHRKGATNTKRTIEHQPKKKGNKGGEPKPRTL